MGLKISVITPSFNSGDTIEKAICSVLDQDYTNYEHIVIDGGSTDNTLDILRKYSHLIWVSEKDEGQSNAMNKGFRMSTGEVIVYLNADDYFLCGAFSAVIPHLEQGHKIVVGDVVVQMSNGYFINTPSVELSEMIRHWEPNAFPSNPVGYFYHREVQQKIPFNEELDSMMDLHFLFECATHYEFKKINVLLGVYRYLEDTKTGKDQESKEYWSRDNFSLIEKYLALMPPAYQELYEKMRELGYQNRRDYQSQKTPPGEIQGQHAGKENKSIGLAHRTKQLLNILRRPRNRNNSIDLLTLPSNKTLQGKIEDNFYHLKKHDPVYLIYQMGKVGSSSICEALKTQYPPTPLYHIHYLEENRLRESIIWHNENNFQQLPEHLLVSKALGKFIRINQNKVRWKIISLARDPIALQASIIFQNLEEAFSTLIDERSGKVDMARATALVEECLSDFNTRKSHFLNWFDNEINAVFSIDIYNYPFDKERGFSIINKDNVEILLIKFEKLRECFTDAFFEFSGINDIQLPHTNIGSGKKYGSDYKKLTQSLKLPAILCSEIYRTKLVQHFYSPQEITKFMEKWSSN